MLAGFNIVPRPIVEIRKQVVPPNSPGQFDLRIDGQVLADNVQDGGTTGRVPVEPGTRVISEAEGPATDFDFFDITIVCVHYDGGRVHTQSASARPGLGSSMDLVLTGGEDLICTIKNRLPAPSECDGMTFDNVILGTPGTNKDDVLRGTLGRDIIIGYGGNDTITGHVGDDCISGNGGNDQLVLGADNDIGDGGPGNDVINGGPGNDIMEGGDGNDRLSGREGKDQLRGGEGNDVLNGDADNDWLYGGGGRDSADGGGNAKFDFDICIAETKRYCEG